MLSVIRQLPILLFLSISCFFESTNHIFTLLTFLSIATIIWLVYAYFRAGITFSKYITIFKWRSQPILKK